MYQPGTFSAHSAVFASSKLSIWSITLRIGPAFARPLVPLVGAAKVMRSELLSAPSPKGSHDDGWRPTFFIHPEAARALRAAL